MKRKLSILIALVLAVSLMVVPAAVSAGPGPSIGFWQPGDPAAGSTVEYSDAQSYSPTYSVYLKALKSESPTDDNKEIYVGEPTGVTDLNSLTNVSFWYYAVGGSDPVPPEIDVWLASGDYDYGPPPTGDNEWLLGQFPEVTTFDTWVEVPHSAITWIRATGGHIYGDGSDGLTAAKIDLGTYRVLAIGIQVGGPATRHQNRAGDQEFYVDDLTINAITYDLAPPSTVGLTVVNPQITSISVIPTSIDFGTLLPGESSDVTTLTISNIGSVDVRVDTLIMETGTFFADNLWLDTYLAINYSFDPLNVGGSATPDAQVVVPSTYSAVGEITGTLVFEATAK